SVPAPDAQAVPHSVPLAQSVPPPDAQAVPLAAQSAPPWSVPSWQSAPLAGQQPVPPAGGYGGGAQAGPWPYGPTAPGSRPGHRTGPATPAKEDPGLSLSYFSPPRRHRPRRARRWSARPRQVAPGAPPPESAAYAAGLPAEFADANRHGSK